MKNRWPEIGHSKAAIKKLKEETPKYLRRSEVQAVSLVPRGRGLVSLHLVKVSGVISVFDLLYVPTFLLEAKASQRFQTR